MSRWIIAFAAALCLWEGASSNVVLGQSDQVVLHSGDTARGELKSLTKDEIELDERGTLKKIPRSQIKTINFAGEPRELKAGREAALGDKFDDALETLAKVKLDDSARKEVKEELAYYSAYAKCHLALSGGDRAAAEKEMLDFVRMAGDSFHFYEAAELLGDLAFAAGNFDDASRRYSALTKSAAPDQELRGLYLEGKSLLGKGETATALKRFEEAVAKPLNDESAAKIKSLCEVGKARCIIEAGDAPAGITLVQSVIDKNDPKDSVLFGAAYNTLGAGYLKADQKKNAVIAYMYVDLLFPSDPETHAEALYRLEKLWTEQGKADRAQTCRNMLREQYGGTIWATKS